MNKKSLIGISIPIVLILISFSPVFTAGFIDWDDNLYITDNVLIKSLDINSLKGILTASIAGMYHPITILSFALEYQLAGLNPHIYHINNLLLHMLNSCLVFWLIRRISKNATIAFITTLFFAIHPMRVESVAWISERKDVLYALFYLWALKCYWDYKEKKNSLSISICFILFFLSCMSKAMAVTFPLVLILVDIYQGDKLGIKLFIQKTPFFLLSILTGIINLKTQKTTDLIFSSADGYNFLMNGYVASKGFCFYIIKTIFPINLSALYPMPHQINVGEFLLNIFSILLVIFLIVKSRNKTKTIWFGALFFLLTIGPVLKLIPVGSTFAADRYTYVPALGFFFIAASGYNYIINRFQNLKPIFLILLVVYSGFLCTQTFYRARLWQSSTHLFSDVIKKYPTAYEAYTIIAKIQKKNNNLDEAVNLYKKALSIKGEPGIYLNIATIYALQGRTSEARDAYIEVIQKVPNHIGAHINLGNIYIKNKQYEKALNMYMKAYKINPRDPSILNSIGNAYYYLDDIDKSNSFYLKAIDQRKDFDQAYRNLISNYKQQKKYRLAYKTGRQIINILRKDQKHNLAQQIEGQIKGLK